MGDLGRVGDVARGFLNAHDVGVRSQALHVALADAAAAAAGDVVQDAGDVHGIGDGLEVLIDTLFVGFIVVGGDEQQAVGSQALVGERLGEHGLRGVGARAGDDGDASCNLLDHGGDNGVVLVVGHRGALAGGAQGEDGVGAVLQVEIDKAFERVKVDAAVLFERRNKGDDRALKIADVHVLLLRVRDLDAFVPLGGDGQALVLGTTASTFGARLGQQLSAARQHVECGKVIARALGAADEVGRAIGAQQHLGGAQTAVVVVAHGVAMRAGVVNHEHITHVDMR